MRTIAAVLAALLLLAVPASAQQSPVPGTVQVVVLQWDGNGWVMVSATIIPPQPILVGPTPEVTPSPPTPTPSASATATASPPTPSPSPASTATPSAPTAAPSPTDTPATPSPTSAPTPEPLETPLATLPPPSPQPTTPPDTETCQWIEAQSWWSGPVGGDEPDSIAFPFRHIHFAVCMPTATVSGVVRVPWRAFTHQNVGHLNLVKWQDDVGNTPTTIIQRPDVVLGGDDELRGEFRIDTTKEKDGLRLWRFYAQWEHLNGNLHVARPRFLVRVENGKVDDDLEASTPEGPTGWYQEDSPARDWGYTSATMTYPDRLALLDPKCGAWTFDARITLNDKGTGPPLVGWSIHLDPDFHHGHIGTVIAEGPGELRGRITVPALPDGPHRLVLRGIQQDQGKHHEGVGSYGFTVDC